MAQLQLKADQRKIFGRKVKKLRAEGQIPAHVFGHGIKTVHISVPVGNFRKLYDEAGETTIVNLQVGDGEKRPVLIRGVQTNPVTDNILHVDFYQVKLTEKVKVAVPVEIIGESKAVEQKLGILLQPLSEIEVEALPADLPESVKVDISKLEKLDDGVLVKDLAVGKGVTVLADPEETVVKIGELVTRETEEILAEVEAEREAAATQAAEEAPPAEVTPAEKAAQEPPEEKPAEEKA